MTVLNAIVFNAASAMPNDRPARAVRILRAAARHGALLLGTECDDLTDDLLTEFLDPHLWWWVHDNTPSRDGLLIAGRHDRTTPVLTRYFPGAPASPVNAEREILRQVIDVDRRWAFSLALMHFPRVDDFRGELAHHAMLDSSRKVGADLLAADFNVRRAEIARYYPKRTIRSDGKVQGVAAGRRLIVGAPKAIDLLPDEDGDDHPGLKVTIKPRVGR